MKNELINSEINYSKIGKYSFKKNLYLFNPKDYLSNLKKLLAYKQEKPKYIMKDIINSTFIPELEKSIFDDDYENEHNSIIKNQLKKYLTPRENYKYHFLQAEANRNRPKIHIEEHILFLTPYKEFGQENSFRKKSNTNTLDKITGRNETKNNKKIDKKDLSINIQRKSIKNNFDIFKSSFNTNNDNSLLKEQNNAKKNFKKIIKNRIFLQKFINKNIEKNNFLSIQNSTKMNTIEVRKINLKNYNTKLIKKLHINNNKQKANINPEENNYYSIDCSKHIRSLNFNRMLSRKNKQNKDSKEIGGIYNSVSPKYDYIHPKTIFNFLYKEKTISKKNFSPKYRKNTFEVALDLDKVYNKYNNHRESQSFSMEKIQGRKQLNKKDEDSKEKKFKRNNKENIDTNKNNISERNLINTYLEGCYKNIIKQSILNKDKKTIEDCRLIKAIIRNKINANYKKLVKIFNDYKFMHEINNKELHENI